MRAFRFCNIDAMFCLCYDFSTFRTFAQLSATSCSSLMQLFATAAFYYRAFTGSLFGPQLIADVRVTYSRSYLGIVLRYRVLLSY